MRNCTICAREFQSTPSPWRATQCGTDSLADLSISIHALPVEGDRLRLRLPRWIILYFNPRPPRGGRRPPKRSPPRPRHFNPRPPRGGRQMGSRGFCKRRQNFNPRPPRGGRRCPALRLPAWRYMISIHALPVEGDGDAYCFSDVEKYISIHALPVEGDKT